MVENEFFARGEIGKEIAVGNGSASVDPHVAHTVARIHSFEWCPSAGRRGIGIAYFMSPALFYNYYVGFSSGTKFTSVFDSEEMRRSGSVETRYILRLEHIEQHGKSKLHRGRSRRGFQSSALLFLREMRRVIRTYGSDPARAGCIEERPTVGGSLDSRINLYAGAFAEIVA